MGMTIDNANKLLSVITSTITEDDDCFTIEDENLQVFKETLLTAIDTMRKYQQLQADYENRLKADMVAMLTEIQLEYSEYASVFMQWNDTMSKKKIAHEALKASKDKMIDLLQQQINSLKEAQNDRKENI